MVELSSLRTIQWWKGLHEEVAPKARELIAMRAAVQREEKGPAEKEVIGMTEETTKSVESTTILPTGIISVPTAPQHLLVRALRGIALGEVQSDLRAQNMPLQAEERMTDTTDDKFSRQIPLRRYDSVDIK